MRINQLAPFLFAWCSLQAATPTITSFTASTTTGVVGTTVQLCWVVGNIPTSITITPGLAGTSTAYTDTTNPASGCTNFTLAANSRIRLFGDSIGCGFRTTGAASHSPDATLPCGPNATVPSGSNGSPSAYLLVTQSQLIASNIAVPSAINLAVTGEGVAGQTPPTCTGSGFYPDIVIAEYGANDLAGAGSPATFETNISNYWATAKANGCTVVAHTVTPRTNITNDVTVRQAANAYIVSNYATSAVALINIGQDSLMSCATCNEVGHVTTGVNSYYTTLDCTPTCPDGTKLTHWSDAGHIYAATNYANSAFQAALKVPYTITATNGSGTSAATLVTGGGVLVYLGGGSVTSGRVISSGNLIHH